jgi:hypothetical protein
MVVRITTPGEESKVQSGFSGAPNVFTLDFNDMALRKDPMTGRAHPLKQSTRAPCFSSKPCLTSCLQACHTVAEIEGPEILHVSTM